MVMSSMFDDDAGGASADVWSEFAGDDDFEQAARQVMAMRTMSWWIEVQGFMVGFTYAIFPVRCEFFVNFHQVAESNPLSMSF